MNVRIALLITAAWLTVVSVPARAELQPKDPDHATIASVDRFSDKAGTLLVRSADKRLPGPNEPIDFDAAAFEHTRLVTNGKAGALLSSGRSEHDAVAGLHSLSGRRREGPCRVNSISSIRCPVKRVTTISSGFGKYGCRRIIEPTQ